MVEWSCTKEKINERRPYILVEWSCTKERLNERGPYILVEWSCANKKNKSVGTLNSGRMVVHIASAKMTVHEGILSPYSFYGQMLDCWVYNFQSMNSLMELNSLFSKFFCYMSPDLLDDTWLDARMDDLQRPLCFSETIAYGLKIKNCINHTFSVLSTQSMSSS